MNTDRNERDRLNELFEELERVRTGRSVRRRATVAGAAIALIVASGAVLVSGPSPSSTGAPDGPLAERPAEPPFTSVEIVQSSGVSSRVETVRTSGSYRHVEFIDDAEFARALREMGVEGGVARIGGKGGRVILTGSLAKAEEKEDDDGPGAM